MQYEWKQTIFKPEDFDGAGQYVVRESKNKINSPHFYDTGYLSTVMYKIGYMHMSKSIQCSNLYILISMSDGLSLPGYYTNTKDAEGNSTDSSTWTFTEFSGEDNYEAKSKLCEFFNNNPHGNTYRFATNEELIRVAAHQKWRTR